MNKTEIVNTLTRSFHKIGFQFKKHSPEILIVSGIAGTVTAAVMACKATTKISEIVDDTKEKVDQVHDILGDEDIPEEEYSVQDSKKDLTIIYTQAAVKFLKLYGPSIALGALSISCIVASNNIHRKRNIALAAAYATVDKGFKEYRSRVVERFGSEIDKELRYNIKAKTFEKVVTDEKGKEKVEKEIVNVSDNPNNYSDYAVVYDDGCKGWCKDPELNKSFLKAQMVYADKKLKTNRYLFLNEVYDMLGIPKTKAGQVVGWIYDEKYPVGDNYVDFGIYDINCERTRDFINGYERNVILDFNVDGYILDKM